MSSHWIARINGKSTSFVFSPREGGKLRETTGHITVGSAIILWNYKNITQAHAGALLVGGQNYVIDEGFYTISDMRDFLEDAGVTLTPIPATGRCNITGHSSLDLNLSEEVKRIIGFTDNGFPLGAGNLAKGQSQADVTLGLGYIKIHCDIADMTMNTENGESSTVIAVLPLPDSRLLGSTQEIKDVNTTTRIAIGPKKLLTLRVTDMNNNPVDIGTVVLVCHGS